MNGEDLIARIRAALDEEERIARATFLSEADGGDWIASINSDTGEVSGVLGHCIHIGMIGGNGDLDDPAQVHHIVEQSPKRTLRRIAAQRRTLERHMPQLIRLPGEHEGRLRCFSCRTDGPFLDDVDVRVGDAARARYDRLACPVAWPCDDIRDLADSLGIEVDDA